MLNRRLCDIANRGIPPILNAGSAKNMPVPVLRAAREIVKGKNPERETEQVASIRYRGELYSIVLKPSFLGDRWVWTW